MNPYDVMYASNFLDTDIQSIRSGNIARRVSADVKTDGGSGAFTGPMLSSQV